MNEVNETPEPIWAPETIMARCPRCGGNGKGKGAGSTLDAPTLACAGSTLDAPTLACTTCDGSGIAPIAVYRLGDGKP